MSKTNFIAFISFILWIHITSINCSKDVVDPCADTVNLGIFELYPGTVDLLAYRPQDSVVIFKDIMDFEYRFRIENKEGIDSSFSFQHSCIENTNQIINYTYRSIGGTGYLLSNEIFDFGIFISLNPVYNTANPEAKQHADLLRFDLIDPLSSDTSFQLLNIIVDQGNHPPFNWAPRFEEQLTLGNKTFDQVYYEDRLFSNGRYIIYFNQTDGIVGIDDKEGNVLFIYDKIE